MNRRSFIQNMGNGLGLMGAMAMIPQPLWAMAEHHSGIQQAFTNALANNPRLIGHANETRERDVARLKLEGNIPTGFTGSLYRNGPAVMERNGLRYDHLFEGDGMIRAFHFQDNQISYRDRFVRTSKYLHEETAGRFLYDGPGTDIPNSIGVNSPDAVNTANTNVIAVGDELWALWEAGSATRMTRESLETNGTVTLSKGLKAMPFSAHPKQDPNGDIWNFGLDYNTGRVIFYHLSPSGKLKNTGLVNSGYHAMLHDFLITDKHILLILPSLDISGSGNRFFSKLAYQSQQAVRLLVIDKNDLTLKRRHDLPPGFMFHFGNGWEDTDGTVHFDCCRYDNFDIMAGLGNLMAGKSDNSLKMTSETVIYHVTKSGNITEDHIPGDAEFPRIYPHISGHQNNSLFHVYAKTSSHWMDTVRRIDLKKETSDEYHYGPEYLVEEHVAVEGPNNNPQSGGWVVGTALHWPSKRSCVNIFQADRLADGPLARGWLDFPISLGFHGNFVKT